ncbi:MAG: DUF4469 domain-containing protein, partial [Spirochaetaceae bacterium]|nr:DUF4469 domain-containing protein [Spirochaetaceae bacterium]
YSIHTRIGGTYHGANDHISAEELHLTFRELRHLKDLLGRVKIENEGIAGDGAYIDEISDVHTGSLNSALTPGNMIRIQGHKIKVEGEGAEVGVWFVSQADGARVKITEHLGINRSAEIFGLIPALTAGSYKLEVVTQFTGSGVLLKEARTIALEAALTVV